MDSEGKTDTFPASLASLFEMMQWVRERIEEAGLPERAGKQVEIALEEALVNIVHYAYKRKKGTIEISSSHTPHELIFTIKDKGIPFNPLLKGEPIEREAPLEERAEGGLGIQLIKYYMDEVKYFHDGECNALVLTKRLFC